jgi:uncharacterized protein
MKQACALITGASFGIGRAIADRCAKNGMNLILVSLPGENLEETSYELGSRYGVKTFFIEIDLARSESSTVIYEWCKEKDLVIHTLVNNAGIGYQGKFDKLDVSFCENLLQLNVIALTLMTRLLLPGLMLQKNAYILNVSSLGSFYPMPFKAVYAASKSYVTAFSEALHEELKDTSVTVSTLCPAGVDSYQESTEQINKIGWIAKAGRLTPDQVADAAVAGMLKKKRRIIPGRINNFFHFITRPLPSKVKAWFVHFVLAKFHRRAVSKTQPMERSTNEI